MYNLPRSQCKVKHNKPHYFITMSSFLVVFVSILTMCSSRQLVGIFAQQVTDQQVPIPLQRQQNPGPRVIIYPEQPVFTVNSKDPSSRVLTCQTTGDSPEIFETLKWSGPNSWNNWDELKTKHIVREVDQNSWVLEFKNPTHDDSGTYYCQTKYQSSDAKNASVEVKIENPIELTNCPERQFLTAGESGKITCGITGDSPKVNIKKDGLSISNSNKRYKWDVDGLVIDGTVEKTDSGSYDIWVRSPQTGGSTKRIIKVEVHTKPEIAPFRETESDGVFHIIEGEKAILECNVSGNPTPLVYWFDNRLRNLTSVGGYHVNPEMGTLIIDRVNRYDDHGIFQCHAKNTVGQSNRSLSVAVDTKPSVVLFNNITTDELSDTHFECRASGEPQPVFSIRKQGIESKPYKIGDGFVKDVRTELETGGSNIYVHRLTILTTKSSYGLHYCNVTNRAGTAERVGQLLVNYKPDLSHTPSEQYVKNGKNVTVTCHIKAYPLPTVTWSTGNTQILNVQTSFKTSPDQQTHIVTMQPSSGQAPYSRIICQAKNLMGESEQVIIPKYTTRPGSVNHHIVSRGSTIIKLNLDVPNDGGDRIKNFRYKVHGKSLDIHNPLASYRDDEQNETTLDASPNPNMVYTIRNLLPYYSYAITIYAVNDNGGGDPTQFHIDTNKPDRPEKPNIIKTSLYSNINPGITSEYQNGYLLQWSPPELDNGDPVTKYIIKYCRVETDSAETNPDDSNQKIVEQMNERPLNAKLGPLEPNKRYKIQIQARNKYGDSEPDSIVIYTSSSKPSMVEFESKALAWLIEPTPPTIVAIIAVCIALIIIVDLIFCFTCQIGFSHWIRSYCCPTKKTSVNSD